MKELFLLVSGYRFFWWLKLYNLESVASDHNPIFLVLQHVCKPNNPYHFRFKNAWLLDPTCAQLVKYGWEGDNELSIQQKVKVCVNNLAIWGKEITENFSGRIKSCKE